MPSKKHKTIAEANIGKSTRKRKQHMQGLANKRTKAKESSLTTGGCRAFCYSWWTGIYSSASLMVPNDSRQENDHWQSTSSKKLHKFHLKTHVAVAGVAVALTESLLLLFAFEHSFACWLPWNLRFCGRLPQTFLSEGIFTEFTTACIQNNDKYRHKIRKTCWNLHNKAHRKWKLLNHKD